MKDPTRRFSSRVANYSRYRPGYPPEIIPFLESACELSRDSVIADLGSGTGRLTSLFLDNGNVVHAVEPNAEMRRAADESLGGRPAFWSVDGSAEGTTLENASVDFVVAGQAFHWFEQDRARIEFARILRPGGWVVLIWNDRQTDSTPFLRDFEDLLLEYGTDYRQVDHKRVDACVIGRFLGHEQVRREVFPNRQTFDHEGLTGRLLSSSYVPEAPEPGHPAMMQRLREIFEIHAKNGAVEVLYDTIVYCGRLHGIGHGS